MIMLMTGTADWITAMAPAFDPATPSQSGCLMGESFAAVVEMHGRPIRQDELSRLNKIVLDYLDRTAGTLRALGFDDDAARIYRRNTMVTFACVVQTYHCKAPGHKRRDQSWSK
jgi:hypothetical protein